MSITKTAIGGMGDHPWNATPDESVPLVLVIGVESMAVTRGT
jgi:hypothetical protein